MHDCTIFEIVVGGLMITLLHWLAVRASVTINQEQTKRCGKVVIGFYFGMVAFFLMGLVLTFIGACFIFNDLPGNVFLPWTPRAIIGGFQITEGAAGLFMASSVLRRDPKPVNWSYEFSRLKAGLRQNFGLDQ